MTKNNGLHWKYRTIDDLHEGDLAYVCFSKDPIKVKVLRILKEPNVIDVEILEGKYKGNIHQLFPDEVRLKPEEAIINCVTL